MGPRAPSPLVIAVCAASLAYGVAVAQPVRVEPSSVVAWPASHGLLIGEVVTGGASGSDEYAEMYNASSVPLDLGGLELAYVTSSGATVTRKATWEAGTLLPAGGHLLVANSAGIHAGQADALYSGGFAASGGALLVRSVGGSPIDAVAWGDAVNDFVEGAVAPAPPAGQSIERRPGGLLGNGQDTNDNAADFLANPSPSVQNLAAPPVPAPQPTATLMPSPMPSPTGGPIPTASCSPSPSASAFPTATPGPTDTPAPTSSPESTETPTATPDPSATPTPTPDPTATSTASPASTPEALTIAQARAAADGEIVDVVAGLTTPPGLVEAGTGAFIQDDTAGISLYLASASWPAVAQGVRLRVHGTVDDRYGQRTIRLAASSDIVALADGTLPLPETTATGAAGESLEGRLVTVLARVVGGADTLSDGFAATVDDGSGPLRIVATSASGISPSHLSSGGWFRLTGPLGQRDSSGTGIEGYRLYLRALVDIEAAAPPTASPTQLATASPMPSADATTTPPAIPTPGPSLGPTSAPTSSAAPSPTLAPVLAIAVARTFPLDSVVTVEGVATVEAGRIVDERTVAIQDATAGIAVRLPAEGWPAFARGDLLRVKGITAQRYGGLELRPADPSAITVVGSGVLPAPRVSTAGELGEPLEGRLVRATGIVVSVDSVSPAGNFGVDLEEATGRFRVFVYGTTGIARDAFSRGATVEVTGIEGQHAPFTGSTAGHRIWPRDPADIRVVAPPEPSSEPGASPGPAATGTPGFSPIIRIIEAIRAGGNATVEGIVTTPAGFIDAEGRRIVLEDASGALLARLPVGASAPPVGTKIVARGGLGSYYGSPQLELGELPVIAGSGMPAPTILAGSPRSDFAWRLVQVSGPVTSVRRLGTTWRAELTLGGEVIPIYGGARTGIPSTALVEGRLATVTGVVRPPYPTATDRRPAVAPRFAGDVLLGPATGPGALASGGSGGGGIGGHGAGEPGSAVPIDVDLAELADYQAKLVRVGGLVVSASAARIVIDDGTARVPILLPPDAMGSAADVRPGDPLNAIGTVVRDGQAFAVAPRSAADIARVGRLGELAPFLEPTPRATTSQAPAALERLGSQGGWPLGALPTALVLAATGLLILLRGGVAQRLWRALAAARGQRPARG